MSELNPHNTDAILGGQNPPPVNAAILGGLAGVKQRLDSESIVEKIQALNDAVQYGERAIDLALQALTDESYEIQYLASKLLRYRFGTAGEEALWKDEPSKIHIHYNPFYQPRSSQKIYDDKVGLVNPEDITYVVKVSNVNNSNIEIVNLELLMDDLNIDSLRSLIIELSYFLDAGIYSCQLIREAMHPILIEGISPKLKSLGISYKFQGDIYEIQGDKYKVSTEAIQKEGDDLYEMVFNTLVMQQSLKYFALDLPRCSLGEYFSTEKQQSEKYKY
jgi:hypothetical protein